MFNIGPAELLVIGLVLLIAVGPEQLPGVIRRVGSTVAQMRSMTDGLRSEFMAGLDEIERATDVKRWSAEDDDAANADASDDVDVDADADAANDADADAANGDGEGEGDDDAGSDGSLASAKGHRVPRYGAPEASSSANGDRTVEATRADSPASGGAGDTPTDTDAPGDPLSDPTAPSWATTGGAIEDAAEPGPTDRGSADTDSPEIEAPDGPGTDGVWPGAASSDDDLRASQPSGPAEHEEGSA